MQIKRPIIGVDIFLERRKNRLYVGTLRKENAQYIFTYDDHYLHAKNVIPLGPEFPLTRKVFTSADLFPSLDDRIPSKQNPAYSEYCYAVGIQPDESDPLVLLSTIGKRGPSAFVFEPLFLRSFTFEDVKAFRRALGFTTREFAEIFEISQSSLNALERKRKTGKEILKRLEIIVRFPDVAIYYLTLNGGVLSNEKWQAAESHLKKMRKVEFSWV